MEAEGSKVFSQIVLGKEDRHDLDLGSLDSYL